MIQYLKQPSGISRYLLATLPPSAILLCALLIGTPTPTGKTYAIPPASSTTTTLLPWQLTSDSPIGYAWTCALPLQDGGFLLGGITSKNMPTVIRISGKGTVLWHWYLPQIQGQPRAITLTRNGIWVFIEQTSTEKSDEKGLVIIQADVTGRIRRGWQLPLSSMDNPPTNLILNHVLWTGAGDRFYLIGAIQRAGKYSGLVATLSITQAQATIQFQEYTFTGHTLFSSAILVRPPKPTAQPKPASSKTPAKPQTILYIAGSTWNAIHRKDALLLRLQPDGQVTWSVAYDMQGNDQIDHLTYINDTLWATGRTLLTGQGFHAWFLPILQDGTPLTPLQLQTPISGITSLLYTELAFRHWFIASSEYEEAGEINTGFFLWMPTWKDSLPNHTLRLFTTKPTTSRTRFFFFSSCNRRDTLCRTLFAEFGDPTILFHPYHVPPNPTLDSCLFRYFVVREIKITKADHPPRQTLLLARRQTSTYTLQTLPADRIKPEALRWKRLRLCTSSSSSTKNKATK